MDAVTAHLDVGGAARGEYREYGVRYNRYVGKQKATITWKEETMREPQEYKYQIGDLVYVAETHRVHGKGEIRRVTSKMYGDGTIYIGVNGQKADADKCYRLLRRHEPVAQGTVTCKILPDGTLGEPFMEPHSHPSIKAYYAGPTVIVQLPPKTNPELEKMKQELSAAEESMKKMREQIRKMEQKQ